MSKLGKLNYYLLQWFFVRLAKTVDESGTIIKWGFITKVIPMTGWKTPYRYLNK